MLNKISLILFLTVISYSTQLNAQTGEERLFVFEDRTIPDDKNVLFYIHKNTNPNAIVYALNILDDGTINPKDPIEVFWRRYQEDGRKKKLGWLEKTFAFDFKVKASETKENSYIFSLIAMKNKQLFATQNKNGGPQVATKIDGKLSHLDRIYLMVDDTKTIQEVLSMELFGRDLKTGKLAYEKIIK